MFPRATAGRRARRWLLLALISLPAREAAALEPGLRFEQYAHTSWPSVAHASDLHALHLSSSGILVIGTSDGLARFDGQRMVTYDAGHHPGMPAGMINRAIQTADGAVWVGTFTHGLARMRDNVFVPLGAREGVPPGRIQAFFADDAGDLWVGTSQGMARFAAGAAPAVAVDQGLPSACVHIFARAPDGTLWAGLHEGIARWDAGAARWRADASLPARSGIDALWADGDGTVWGGTRDDGLWRRSGGGWQKVSTDPKLRTIRALLRDRQGHLWVATAEALFWLAGGEFHEFEMPATVCARRVRVMTEDAENGLWLATEGCGLHRLQDRRFRTYTVGDGLPSDGMLGLAVTRDGTVWAGTRGAGIVRWKGDVVAPERISCAAGLPCAECWDFSSRGSEMWTVCRHNQVLHWDGRQVSRPGPVPGGLPEASFNLAASDGSRWMALEKKVVRQDGETARSIQEQEVLEGVRLLYEGGSGTIWIVAEDGVAIWRNGQIRIVRLPPTEHPAEPSNVFEDAAGTLWIGTKGEGIRRLKEDRIATVGVASGLPTGWIVQPVEDLQGRVWATSSRGIFMVPKRELAEVADGKRARVQAIVYDVTDGVQMRGDDYGHPAGFRDARGSLWFATNGGVATVDPTTLGAPALPASLEDVRLDGQPLDPARRLVPTAPRDLDFTFSARTFAPPDTLSFRYRLHGRDADWIDAGGARSAHYGQLGPGDYRLAVQARHREGAWTTQAAVLSFSLRPPFHRSPFFVLACALGAGLILLLMHRVRIGQTRAGMQAVVLERSRIARDIHDTLAQAFAATSVQLECLAEALEEGDVATADRHLDTARKVVEESLDEARRAVWVLRPQAVEQGLAVALETLVSRVSGGTPVALDVTGAERELPPMVASNLLRIAHEAVANARRHARADHIALQLAFSPRSVSLTISDDGRGMGEPSADGTGIIGMKERAADISGILTIEDAPAGGTTVRVEVPA